MLIKGFLYSKLSDKDAHNEELIREIGNLKRKVARTSGEMADMKLLLEKSQSRNAELEKKQRRLVNLSCCSWLPLIDHLFKKILSQFNPVI